MSDQIWMTKVADARTNAPFRPPLIDGPWEEKEKRRLMLTSNSLGQRIDAAELADHYTLLEHLTREDVPTLPPVISLSQRCVSDDYKTVIEQFDIGRTYFHKIALQDRSDPPVVLRSYWAIVVQEGRATVDREAGLREGWLKPHPRFPEESARYRPNNSDIVELKIKPNFDPPFDLWCDDYLVGMLFFSDRLKRTLDTLPGVEHFHLSPVGPATSGGGGV